ncbi:DNA-binding protein [Burkholderia sp. SIMBA_043]|uniref:DNA-binding protein n=2 Tax=Pseudomonadota TaxID=1224 RepID=UPI0005EFD2CD|nr:DNA-binding protein [Burkholderia vietnamiensis]AVR14819.1 transcriptional regulator [Burkholderia vietnamiensis]KVF14444.1 transcriptional regulator [Burkholderia vietnamiensis]KVF72748.1 transcriptional regulator [Burkholderia vietnamiensis]KVF80042.1 transcriptional regulator [Burkholderia vietnamiensis]KVF84868.1 transcriptional regulator [Burkholderia vietnamiensis]
MPRPAATTPDQIRSTVLAMLAEAGDATPATGARFRKLVSVRKLRARLGAGDPATLSRALNAIEAEVVRSGLSEIAIPGVPPEIAEQMHALWQAAVAVQLDDVVRLKREAQEAIDAADAARTDAEMRVELLRQEITELRSALTARDAELADVRAQHALVQERCATLDAAAVECQAALDAAVTKHAELDRAHVEALAAAQHRYEALSKQLLQETAHQREALKKEHAQSASQLKFAERRIAALEAERDRLDGELAHEREARQRAVGEALALKAVNAQQHAQLGDLLRDIAPKPGRATTHAGLASAKRTASGTAAKRKSK